MGRPSIIALVVVVVVALGYWLYQEFGRGHLDIQSEPSGAVVRLDSTRIGTTPLSVTIDPGRHLLRLEHSYFQAHEEPIDVDLGDTVRRQISLVPGMGTLKLLSNPPGAWVEVDGQRLSRVTPTLMESAGGEKVIRMGMAERFDIEETVTLESGRELEVNLDLNIDPHGSLTVRVTPSDASVELPGSDIDYRPGVRVPIGEHLIRVSRYGYETQEFRFKIGYNQNRASASLQRAYGSLSVRVQPAGAEVKVRFRNEQGRRIRKSYSFGMRIPVGKVEVRARSMGYRTGYSEFKMSKKGHSTTLKLMPMDVKPGELLTDELLSGGQGPEMIVIEGGSFVMGDDEGPPSVKPARKIALTQPFAMSVREVSIEEYQRYAQLESVKISSKLAEADLREPIRYVKWTQARDYADWLTAQTGSKYRLPTEAEWEYVARAGGQDDYFFGDDPLLLCEYANLADLSSRKVYSGWTVIDCDDGHPKLAPAGSLKPNPFGVYDINGNVSEWIAECGMPDYGSAPSDASQVDERSGCRSYGFRGGSWDSQPDQLKSTYRGTATTASDDRGIRLVREL